MSFTKYILKIYGLYLCFLKVKNITSDTIGQSIINHAAESAGDVSNYHKDNSVLKFLYIESDVIIDGQNAKVKITIKKSPQKNKFWVHHVYIENGAGSYSAVNSKVHKTAYTSSSTEDRIAQNGQSVKKDTESYSIPAEEDFDKYELSSEEKEFIEKFSNREYNNRGWASLLFSQEDASLLNEYFAQRFKLNHKDSGITLGDGTKVIEVNNKIVFAGGTFNDPIIYCVLVVNAENNTDFEYLKELYLEQNDYRQLKKETVYSWYRDIQEISGEEIFRVFARRDYIQTQRTTEGRQPPILPNSWRGFGYSKEQHRRGSYKSKNKRFEIRFDDDVDYSIPSETSDIYDRYDRGEISREELTAALQKEWMKAGEQYGTYEHCACCLLHR